MPPPNSSPTPWSKQNIDAVRFAATQAGPSLIPATETKKNMILIWIVHVQLGVGLLLAKRINTILVGTIQQKARRAGERARKREREIEQERERE
jgi:hypothetical protein